MVLLLVARDSSKCRRHHKDAGEFMGSRTLALWSGTIAFAAMAPSWRRAYVWEIFR